MVRYYEIAGLILACYLPETEFFQESVQYSRFRSEAKEADVQVDCFIKEIEKERGTLVYQDERQHIRTEQDEILRYIGNFSLDEKIGKPLICQRYQKGKPGKYKIYLSGNGEYFSEKFFMDNMGLDHIMVDFGRVILHSSFLVYRGEGILFSAPSGTGKSTQADLWEKYLPGTEIVNGDRSILGYKEGRIWAYGLPMCGSSGITKQIYAPVKSIVVLRQGKENQLSRLKPSHAFRFLLSECGVSLWSKEDMEQVMQILQDVVQHVPVYYFSCRPDEYAVYTLRNVLYKD